MTNFTIAYMAGFISSLPMGPSGHSIFQHGSLGRRRIALACLGAFLLAELIIASLFIFLDLDPTLVIGKQSLEVIAGVFLVAFSIILFCSSRQISDDKKGLSPIQVFNLSLLNPGTWLAVGVTLNFVAAQLDQNLSQRILIVAALELGVASYFLLIIWRAASLSIRNRNKISKIISLAILMGGLLYLGRAANAHASTKDDQAQIECQVVHTYGQSTREDCELERPDGKVKNFHILNLKGDHKENAFAHGYLMSEEINHGVLKETLEKIDHALKENGRVENYFTKKVFYCYFDRIKASVSNEFSQTVNGIYRGMKKRRLEDGYKDTLYSKQDIWMAAIGVEISIASEGLAKRMESSPLITFMSLSSDCGIVLGLRDLKMAISKLSSLAKMLKLGCLGFIAPSAMTEVGVGLLHARNLDANLVDSWNRYPVFYYINETNKHKYVGVGTAGLVYHGGVSGMNQHGLSASLHEMSTKRYRTYFRKRKADVAPYVQERILKEAKNLDEAIRLIKRTKHFGSWTYFISDAKSGKGASVEVSGYKTSVARTSNDQSSLGQSNHFLGKGMEKEHFTYNFNKTLESHSRLKVVEEDMIASSGQIDLSWAIDHLSGHKDYYEGFRSFGRTATKAYTVMSTIALPDQNAFWFTIGDQNPASHSYFVGFEVDFNQNTLQLLGAKRTQQFNALPKWEKSLSLYIEARMAYEKGNTKQSLDYLNQAITLAEDDGIDEAPYLFMKGRLLGELGEHNEAAIYFERLLTEKHKLHPYGWAMAYTQLLWNKERSGKDEFLSTSYEQYQKASLIYEQLFEKYEHFDLKNKIEFHKELGSKNSTAHENAIHIDFVTIE